jgi:hypothetical protein
MREVLTELTRLGGFAFGCFLVLAVGLFGELTGLAMRDFFVELIRFGGAGFDDFGALRAAGDLGVLRLGVTFVARCEALGGIERGVGRLGWGVLALADERGWLLRCGRAEALGAGWLLRCGRAAALGAGWLLRCGRAAALGAGLDLLGRATLAAGARFLPTFEGLLALAVGDDF